MKVVILAGGFGTRISEESHLKPKPMIEIGGIPILVHIMKYYSSFGHNDFIICAGYRQDVIKEYFSNYFLHISDVEFDFSNNETRILKKDKINWKVKIIDTGYNTMTGGRVKRIEKYIDEENFLLTYGDGLSNVDINEVIDKHVKEKNILTITAIRPGGRYGKLDIGSNSIIKKFEEKNIDDGGWVNGGFMVANKQLFSYINSDSDVLEQKPMKDLVKNKQLHAFKHYGFWQCMDTMRDKEFLEDLWNENDCPWIK